jgi:hypothetical protein
MSEQSPEQSRTDGDAPEESVTEQQKYGSLSIEDDPDGTEDPAELAGSADPDDAVVSYQPSASEADDL